MASPQLVARVNLFEGLEDEQIAKLAAIGIVKSCQRSQIIFHAGDTADGLYAVVKGKVRIFRSSPSGKEHILHVFGPGESFGEAAVFQGASFPASAEALEDGEILFFPRVAFAALIREDPEMAMEMLALLSQRLRIFVKKIEELSLKEVPARLAAYLMLLHSAQKSDVLVLDLSKGQVASYLGTIPETLSRVFKRLAEEGCIGIQGSKITLLDIQALERIALGDK